MMSRVAIPTIQGPLPPSQAGAARLGLALVALAAGCGGPAMPPNARPPAPAAQPEPASPAAVTPESDVCPPLADPAGWFGLGGSGPADDGVRAVAAGGGGGVATAPGLSSAATGFDETERPLVAWLQDQGVLVRRREAHGWEPLGASDRALGVRAVGADGPRGARLRDGFGLWSPAIAGVGADDVLVAWVDGAPPWEGRVRAARWSSGAWRDAMPGRSPGVMCRRWDGEFGASAEPPVLHVDRAGRITAACMQPIADPTTMPTMMPSGGPIARLVLQVWQWDGRRWRTLPPAPLQAAGPDGQARAQGPMGGVTYGHGIALATDDAGAPVVLHGATFRASGSASGSAPGDSPAQTTRWQRLRWQPARRTWQRESVTAPAGATAMAMAPTSAQGPQPLWRDAGGLGIGDQAARVPLPPLLAGPGSDPTASFALGAAASPAGKLAVASTMRVGLEYAPYTLHVHVWNGAAWTDPGATHRSGGVSATPGTSRQPALALDGCGRPTVAWIEHHAGGRDVYLRRWSGRDWEALAGSAQGGGVSASGRALAAAVTVEPGGAPVVLWWEPSGTAGYGPSLMVHARRFRDGRWIDVGAPELVDDAQLMVSDTWLGTGPGRTLVAAAPVVGAASVRLLRRDRDAWQHEVRGQGSGGPGRWPALARDGVLRAFWLDPGGSQLVGAAWRDGWHVERTLALGAGPVSEAAAARDDAGHVYLAWTRAGVWPTELSVSASGSASGSGSVPDAPGTAGADSLAPLGSASNSAGHAREPAIAVGARVCVAWSEVGTDSSEIYLRCHVPGQPGQAP
jgi:hypothetical protein